MDKALTLLGLALRAGRLEIGEECVSSACTCKKARLVIVARDAAARSTRRAMLSAQQGQCLCLTVPYAKEELGRAVGRELCAMCAFTDLGLAGAFASQLAGENPERFGPAAERLQLKRERAKKRREKPKASRKTAWGKQKPAGKQKT